MHLCRNRRSVTFPSGPEQLLAATALTPATKEDSESLLRGGSECLPIRCCVSFIH